jgi:hypothetical protein
MGRELMRGDERQRNALKVLDDGRRKPPLPPSPPRHLKTDRIIVTWVCVAVWIWWTFWHR